MVVYVHVARYFTYFNVRVYSTVVRTRSVDSAKRRIHLVERLC